MERLVLGHPINMDGTRGPRSEKAQAMRQLLKETHRPAGGPVGRAAHHHRRSPDPDEQRQERQEAEKGGGRCGGIADSGGLPHLFKNAPGGIMASGPGRTSVRDRLHMSLIPPPLPHRRVQAPRRAPAAGTAAAPADRRKRSARKTPWENCRPPSGARRAPTRSPAAGRSP